MRIPAGLVGLALTAVATGCVGSGSASHSTLTGAAARHRARADGFINVARTVSESWHCDAHGAQVGPPQTTGRHASYTRSTYGVEFGDRRAPPTENDTARIAVLVFADARVTARCAHAGIYTSEHQPVDLNAAALGHHSRTRFRTG